MEGCIFTLLFVVIGVLVAADWLNVKINEAELRRAIREGNQDEIIRLNGFFYERRQKKQEAARRNQEDDDDYFLYDEDSYR